MIWNSLGLIASIAIPFSRSEQTLWRRGLPAVGFMTAARRVLFITPRLAVQKGDFLGSGVPYWPLEAAITASLWRKSNWDVSVLDLFGLAPERLTSDNDLYWQGMPLDEALTSASIDPATFDCVLVYALSPACRITNS